MYRLFLSSALLSCILLFQPLSAQEGRFNAALIAGLNFAELEGDELMDYYGINAGLMGTMRITPHFQMGMELLFSQNGEYILPDYYPAVQYGTIWLNHIEIPIHFDFLIGVFEREDFYDWNLNIGIAYTRLLSYYGEDFLQNDVTDQVVYENKEARLLQFGTTYNFSRRFGLNFKASLPIRVEALDWTVAVRMVYTIT